jgi:hypothetical protein
MADAPTFQELFRIARDEALSRNGKLTREVIERQGSDANVLMAAGAGAADEVIGQLVKTAADLYLDSAKGTALDRLVFDRYGLVRKSAAPALGSVEFTTTAANPSSFAIPSGTKLSTADGRQFVTTASATFAAGGTGPVTVAVRSVLAGASQQARANTITSIADAINGSPDDLRVNNALATAGADDEEKDEQLRERARQFWTSARRGTLGAIQSAALAVSGVRKATAFEAIDALGRPAGAVQLILADAFTEQLVAVSPTPAAYQAQSQVLADEVFGALYDVRAAGIYVQVQVAQVTLQGVSLGLSFQGGVNVDQVALQARATVAAYVNTLAPGSPLRVANLVTVLRTIPGLIVTGNEVISPAGDVTPDTLEVLRSSLSLVVAVSLQPDRAIQATTNPDSV